MIGADPGQPRIDHITNSRHGYRSFSHIGGDDDFGFLVATENQSLILGLQSAEKRQNPVGRYPAPEYFNAGSDIFFSGQKKQQITRHPGSADFLGNIDAVLQIGDLRVLFGRRRIDGFDWKGSTFDGDHRGPVEM